MTITRMKYLESKGRRMVRVMVVVTILAGAYAVWNTAHADRLLLVNAGGSPASLSVQIPGTAKVWPPKLLRLVRIIIRTEAADLVQIGLSFEGHISSRKVYTIYDPPSDDPLVIPSVFRYVGKLDLTRDQIPLVHGFTISATGSGYVDLFVTYTIAPEN